MLALSYTKVDSLTSAVKITINIIDLMHNDVTSPEARKEFLA